MTVDVFAPRKYSSLLIYLLKYVINVNKVLQLLFYNNILIFDLVKDNASISLFMSLFVSVFIFYFTYLCLLSSPIYYLVQCRTATEYETICHQHRHLKHHHHHHNFRKMV